MRGKKNGIVSRLIRLFQNSVQSPNPTSPIMAAVIRKGHGSSSIISTWSRAVQAFSKQAGHGAVQLEKQVFCSR